MTYTYLYTHMCVYVYIYIYIYTHIATAPSAYDARVASCHVCHVRRDGLPVLICLLIHAHTRAYTHAGIHAYMHAYKTDYLIRFTSIDLLTLLTRLLTHTRTLVESGPGFLCIITIMIIIKFTIVIIISLS